MNGKNDRERESWLSAAVKPMDGAIAIAAICILSVMDFSKLETVDWIFVVTILRGKLEARNALAALMERDLKHE